MDFKAELYRLLKERSFRFGDFTLTSGKKSSYYFDGKLTTLHPRGAHLVGNAYLNLMEREKVEAEAIGGLVIGADPICVAVSYASYLRGGSIEAFLVRKEAKKHGLQQWIEGPFLEEGTPVAVVDDVLTSGGSLLTAIDRSRKAGAVVVGALVVVDREEGGRAAVEAGLGGAPLISLFTASELLAE